MRIAAKNGCVTAVAASLLVAQGAWAAGTSLANIHIRDPFILPVEQDRSYFLVASSGRSVTVRQSEELNTWGEPKTVFAIPEGFWGGDAIWAPEIHQYRGRYYLFATFMNKEPVGGQWTNWPGRVQRGTQVLVADSPLGPFKPFANRSHTPTSEMALDGTLWIEEGRPYLVYCQEWVQVRDGAMKLVQLSDDLSRTIGEPQLLFKGSEAPWAPRGRDRYITDGPALYRSTSGKLLMLWSSFSETGYTAGIAISDSGKIAGPWRQQPAPFFREDGGHAMIFRRFDGGLMVALHRPNRSPDERCRLFEVEDNGETLVRRDGEKDASAVPNLTGAEALALRSSSSGTTPPWLPKAPALPPPAGQVRRVGTADELLAAVDRLAPGGTILLADGQYALPRPVILDQKQNITLRSASGDPSHVILVGKGWEQGDEHDDILRIGRCEGVTIADLSFADCRSYGIKVEAEHAPKDVNILNCRFQNIGVRAIKGSAAQDSDLRAVKGSVRGCYFENTRIPPADWLFGGDYIAAIDMMALDDWTFSDNVFRNVKGRNGGGRAAIFIWVRSRNVVVERNLIVNCDRGVAFGNPGKSTANIEGERLVYVADSVIRNNFIAGGPDCGIELWYAHQIKVLHNSIWRPQQNWNRGIRIGTGTANTEVANNLVHGGIQSEGGQARVHHNLSGRLDGYFKEPASGNLALTSAATNALARGVPLADVAEDIRRRPRKGNPDLGAWQLSTGVQ